MTSSYHLMLELFVDCNSIRGYCNHLQTEAETMQEVSMNAAIAAGHTGNHIRTFTEIARQIGNSSSRLSNKIHKIRSDTNFIVNETLDAMIRATHLSHFEKCVNKIKSSTNRYLVASQINELNLRIIRSKEKILSELQTIIADLRTTEDILNRVWAVVTRMKIESSSMDAEEQIFVQSIADSLSESIDRANYAFQLLSETIKQFKEKLSYVEQSQSVIAAKVEEEIKHAS